MSLRAKSTTELRSIAQGYGIPNIFELEKDLLIQAIEQKQRNMAPEKVVVIEPSPLIDVQEPCEEYDEVSDILSEHIKRGLSFKVDVDRWYMRFDTRTDEGTMSMPIRTILRCADQLMR